ncbi:hypothetical protein [Tropicimonas aquimaris]|uniref:Uncharacterized protein n=1 Tax=Tropicimonas aquimaris TaxID=914152 RepID=A0ABW3IXC2_9RHOB
MAGSTVTEGADGGLDIGVVQMLTVPNDLEEIRAFEAELRPPVLRRVSANLRLAHPPGARGHPQSSSSGRRLTFRAAT